MRKIILYFTLGTVMCGLFLFALEITVRKFSKYLSPITQTAPILEIDRDLFWHQRPNLNTTFLDLPLETDKYGFRVEKKLEENGKEKIIVLGPSSTFGWGVKTEDTYASKINEITGVNVINGGEIGYSSYQGLKLAQKIIPEFPNLKIGIIAYGINDLDRYRFFFQSTSTDSNTETNKIPEWKIYLDYFVSKSTLINSLIEIRGNVIRYFTPPPVSSSPWKAVQEERVRPEEFEKNITELVIFLKEKNIKPVLLTTTVNFSGDNGYRTTEYVNEHKTKADELWKNGDVKNALLEYKEASEIDPYDSDIWFGISATEKMLGQNSEAREAFNHGRNVEYIRIEKGVKKLNDILKDISGKENVPLIDINKIFLGKDKNTLFVDPIHFSVLGNRLIAEKISEVIKNYYGEK